MGRQAPAAIDLALLHRYGCTDSNLHRFTCIVGSERTAQIPDPLPVNPTLVLSIIADQFITVVNGADNLPHQPQIQHHRLAPASAPPVGISQPGR